MSSQFNSNSSASFGIGISNYNTSNNNVNNFLSGSSGCFSSAGSAAFNQFAAAGGCGGGPNFGPTPSGSGPTPNTTNIILQTLKRRANKNFVPLDERVTLERALGFTITSNTRLTQSSDGLIAYLAGCVIVLYDPTRQTQEFILSSARKTLTTVAFSHDGKLIATGESGHDPKVRVWDVREKTQVCEFGGHKFSIECVCFSTNPSSNLLVSIGSMHDMVVNVWNTRTRFKVASNKIACKVKGIAFARDGAYFVTVGNRHVKFWYLTTSSLMETVPLKGRAAILNEYKNSHFCDVVCGAGECSHYTYALTTNGLICEFEHESRSLRAVVELHTERAYCIYADLYNLFVGCANGAIHIYRQKSLDLIASLPRPHSLGVDVARFVDTRQLSSALAPHHSDMAKYPDCVALCYNAFTLSAIYNDHSFYVWDIRDLSKVKKIDSHLFHSSCCFAVDTFNPSASWQPPGSYSIPVDSFITSSSDNTLRIWSPVTTSSSSYSPDSSTSSNNRLKTNIYSKQLLKVIYIDNDLSALCDQTAILASSADNSDSQSTLSTNGSNGQTSSSSNTIGNTNLPISNITNFSSSDSNSLAPKLGARCLKINPFGNQLATGDRNGNIRIYDLTSPVGASGTLSSKAICMIEAHDGEILYLQYSQPESGRLLLASSSRDRLIHIFDASKLSYDLLQTLDDHSAAIMSVRFYFNSFERQLYVISCGADKSIMIRTTATPESQEFARQSYVVEKQTFHDLIVDESKSCINTISQDRMVRQYSIRDGKKLRQFKGSLNEDGYLLKMDMARNGSLLATSCTDKCVYVYDVNTGECVAYIYGHSEVVLDLKFTSDSQRLITVGGDGCIFIWKLSSLITQIANNTATSTSLSNSASVSQPVVSSTTTTSSRRPVIHTILSAPKQHPVNATLTISQQAAAQGQVPSPTPAVVVGGSASNSLVDSIFDADGLPEWARARISSFNQLSTTSRASTNQSSWSSSTNNSTYIDNTLSDYTSPSNYFQNQQQSQSQQQQPQTQQDKQQRRSRAVWGPPAQNTSFAIMLENESMLSNAGNNTSVVNNANTSLSFATDLNNKEDEDDEDNGAATSSEADDEVDESPAQTSGDIDETIITTTTGSVPFPSPRVDSDFTYPHSKQAKLNENVSSEKQQRFTWTQSIEDENRCCDDGEKHEDEEETNKRQPIPSSTSSATTSSTDSIEEEEELIIVETTTTTTTTTRDVVANQEDEDQEPASSSSSSKSPPPRLFSPTKQQQQEGVSQQPESSALSSPGDDEFHSPSSEIRSLTDKFYGSSENSDQTNNPTSSQTNLIDSIIKLNSDIESTIRRQSISARYLMKTQQQKQQQQHLQAGTPIVGLETGSQSQMRRENECGATSPVSSSSSSVSSSSSCLNETSSGKVTIRKIEDISGVINQALNNAAETNLEGHQKPIIEPRKSPTNSSSSTSSSSSIQMAASELMKMRRRSALLMGVPNSSSSSVSIPSHLATTESSLSKIKTKSTISAAQSSIGSGHLKRSPSASSLVATNEAAAAKSKDRPSVVNNKNISSSAKSSPTKCAPANSSQVNNSQEASESGAGDGETQNGMKKAVSMISLMSNQPSVSSTSSTSSTSSSSSSTMTKTMPKSTSSSKPPLSSTSTMSSSSSSSTTLVNNAAGNMLPPKTVRQIKQRSAERQMTTSGLLTTSTTSTTGAAASSSAFSRNSSINTFNEQNKHIRKLSSSIQNLHNQQQQQQQQHAPKDSNLPPQAPNRASSKSPQLHSSPSKQTKSSQQQQNGLGISHKAKSSSYRTLTTITKPNSINPPPQPQQQKQQQQQQAEEEEPKREAIEITPDQPVEESQTSSEVPNNAVTNPYQNSSNSLTSSSSSSCSIFDSNLASGTSNPLDVDLVGSSASKCGGDGGYRSASTTPNTCSSASSSTSTATTAILNTAATTVATASSGPFKKPVTFASLASHHAANALNLANSSSSGVSNRVGSHSASSMCDSTTNFGNLIGGSGSSSSASPSPVHFHQEMADRIRCEFKQNFYHFHKQMLDESGKYSEQNTPTNDSSHHQYHRPYHLAGAVAAAANQTLTPIQALQFMHTFNTIYASTSQHNNRQQLKSSDLLVESTTSKETVDDETEIEMTA